MQKLHARPSALALLLFCLASASLACKRECRPGSAPNTRRALVPQGSDVHCERTKTFEVEGRKVRLTHIEYGLLRDCPSGCFSSHVCAVEDGDEVLLFYAAWNAANEKPRGVDRECPSLMRDETWPDCKSSGWRHPLAENPKFQAFAEGEAGQGPFHVCVNRLFE